MASCAVARERTMKLYGRTILYGERISEEADKDRGSREVEGVPRQLHGQSLLLWHRLSQVRGHEVSAKPLGEHSVGARKGSNAHARTSVHKAACAR